MFLIHLHVCAWRQQHVKCRKQEGQLELEARLHHLHVQAGVPDFSSLGCYCLLLRTTTYHTHRPTRHPQMCTSSQSLGTQQQHTPLPPHSPHHFFVPTPLTRLGELQCAFAPLGQADDSHHLGAQAAAPFLGCGGPGPASGLLGSTDLTADAGAPHHIPGGPSRGWTRLPVKHGPQDGRASGNSEGGWEKEGFHIRPL